MQIDCKHTDFHKSTQTTTNQHKQQQIVCKHTDFHEATQTTPEQQTLQQSDCKDSDFHETTRCAVILLEHMQIYATVQASNTNQQNKRIKDAQTTH